MKTQVDERVNVNLRAFDWFILSETFFHFSSIRFYSCPQKNILTKRTYESLVEKLDKKVEKIRDKIVDYPEILQGVPPYSFVFNNKPELKERLKTVMIEASLSKSEFDLLFAVVGTLMKYEEDISGAYDLSVMYGWETPIVDLDETYNLLKKIVEELGRVPKSPAKTITPMKSNGASDESAHGASDESARPLVRTFKLPGVDLLFRWIPPGSCLAGAPFLARESFSDETERTISFERGFWAMDSTVTMRALQPFIQRFPEAKTYFENYVAYDRERSGVSYEELLDAPAYVTKRDAEEFCHVLNSEFADEGEAFQLPTEDRWEYAAPAGREYSLVNSKDFILQNCWVWENLEGAEKYPFIRNHPHLRGEKASNPWGLYDMQSNIFEWTSTPFRHPLLDDKKTFRYKRLYVAKGGAYQYAWTHARTSFRTPMIEDCGYKAGLRPVIVSKTR